MRHAIFYAKHGKYCMVHQVLLLYLLQGLLCNGRVLYRSHDRYRYKTLLQNRRFPPKDKAPMAFSQNSQNPLPVLKDFGFLPRRESKTKQKNAINPDPSKNYNSSFDNIDAKIWNAMLSRVFHSNRSEYSTIYNNYLSEHTTQLPVPHLERFGFGASNKQYGHSNKSDNVQTKQIPLTNHKYQYSNRRLAMLGVGCFIGGVAVVLCILSAILLKLKLARHRNTDIETNDIQPKLSPINDDMPTTRAEYFEDTTKEYSSASNSSASASGETSSNFSDNVSQSSFVGDCELADQIPLCTVSSGQSPRSGRFTNTSDDILLWESDHSVLQNTVPDLLLYNTPLPHRHINLHHDSTTQPGVVTNNERDVQTIVPPGAVNDPTNQISVDIRNASEFRLIKNVHDELILTPVIGVLSHPVETFSKAITIKCMYRCLASTDICQCEDDPLCSCHNGHLEIRYCDRPTSASTCRWRSAKCHNFSGHYCWPECFSPEQARTEDKNFACSLERTRQQHDDISVSFRCSDSDCCIKTNTQGLYCLVWVPHNHTGSDLLHHERAAHFNIRQTPSKKHLKMCITIAARHFWRSELTYAESDRCLEQIKYVIYLGDDTAHVKQRMKSAIEQTGCSQQCGFIPVDVAVGSVLQISLASTDDPDWPWEIPYDSVTKNITWQDIFTDYGSIKTVDFRCLPKSDEVTSLQTKQANVISIFDVDECSQLERRSTAKVVASSSYKDKEVAGQSLSWSSLR